MEEIAALLLLVRSFCKTSSSLAPGTATTGGCWATRMAAVAGGTAGATSGTVTATVGGRADAAAGMITVLLYVGTIASVESSGGGGTVMRWPAGTATTGGTVGLAFASFTGTATVAAFTVGTAPGTGVITGGGSAYWLW